MKKSGIIIGSMALTMLTLYGAWCMYKKMCPECAEEKEQCMKKMAKNIEKGVENMM